MAKFRERALRGGVRPSEFTDHKQARFSGLWWVPRVDDGETEASEIAGVAGGKGKAVFERGGSEQRAPFRRQLFTQLSALPNLKLRPMRTTSTLVRRVFVIDPPLIGLESVVVKFTPPKPACKYSNLAES